MKGALFENMLVSEFVKFNRHKGLPANIYYWRDKTGHEIDLILEKNSTLIPIEIKSAKTINESFFKNIKYWKKLSGVKQAYLLYSGVQNQVRSDNTKVINWRDYFMI